MAFTNPTQAAAPTPQLTAPDGIVVETPGVRIVDTGEVSWRIRPQREVSGRFVLRVNGQPIDKRVESGSTQRFVPGRKVNSILEAVFVPDEPVINSKQVEWIDIQYPEADLRLFDIPLNWVLWFFLVSMAAMLLLKKRFGVVI
jgi:hypothetical protein